ncbi:uncharacterized protein [Palaemon carinicauda]|uniref:uncharacterized protein n=1 Tax=Palaemon carinicauda TaxID=392227 RepID=UPI0035B579F5
MFDGLMEFLNTHDIDLQNCRGPSYDNASAMSGRWNGLQSKVVAENKLAEWIPCIKHSLNLVGKTSAECCAAAVAFFYLLEKLHVFFTASTRRYQVLTKTLKSAGSSVFVPKRVSPTRWSSRVDLSKALEQGYSSFKEALMKIEKDKYEKDVIRCKAKGLYDQMCQLEMGIYTVFWHEVLNRVNATSHILQDPKADLHTAVAALTSSQKLIEDKQDLFSEYEAEGAENSGTTTYKQTLTLNRPPRVRMNPLDYG